MKVSGFYLESATNNRVRLDVDGYYPQKAASGVIYYKNNSGGTDLLYWFVRNCQWDSNNNKGRGDVKYLFWNDKRIDPKGWYTTINFGLNTNTNELSLSFAGAGLQTYSAKYKFSSNQFQDVNIEIDYQKGFTPTLSVKPKAIFKQGEVPTDAEFKALPETLTLEEVFNRSGYLVHRTNKDNEVTINAPAGTNPLDYEWSNAELHDMMQKQWSLYNENPKIMSLWTFITTKLKNRPDVGGRMFDSNTGGMNGDTNKKPRQGCALFYRQSTFVDNPPEWNEAAKFISTIHEIGHCFNLFHSFAKKDTNSGLPKPFNPWIPEEMVDSSATKSFMNYHSEYTGGGNYFKEFRYRFSDQELFFMRHAPKWFIKMGENEWGFNHASVNELELTIHTNKPKAIYNFLEPVVIELHLNNNSTQTKKIDRSVLQDTHHTKLFVQKGENGPIERLRAFNHDCIFPHKIDLQPGQMLSESIFVSADVCGWKISEPGTYYIRAVTEVDEQEIFSDVMSLRVLNPLHRDEDILAQEYFSDEVARILNFGGSKFLSKGNNVLKEVIERFSNINPAAALHAQVNLLLPDVNYYNTFNINKSGKPVFQLEDPKVEAIKHLSTLLKNNEKFAIQTLTKSCHTNYMSLIEKK